MTNQNFPTTFLLLDSNEVSYDFLWFYEIHMTGAGFKAHTEQLQVRVSPST
jgi:hypothetical protein